MAIIYNVYYNYCKSGPSNLSFDKMKSAEGFNIRVFVTKSNES